MHYGTCQHILSNANGSGVLFRLSNSSWRKLRSCCRVSLFLNLHGTESGHDFLFLLLHSLKGRMYLMRPPLLFLLKIKRKHHFQQRTLRILMAVEIEVTRSFLTIIQFKLGFSKINCVPLILQCCVQRKLSFNTVVQAILTNQLINPLKFRIIKPISQKT